MCLLDDFEINCLGLSEEKLPPLEFTSDVHGRDWDEKVGGAFLSTRGDSNCPSTPGETNGSTISTVGSPSRAVEVEIMEQGASEIAPEMTFDCRVESKKAQCNN